MIIPNISIAVDGYSSTGKSSFAKRLALDLGLTYLDSGALYRAVTLFAQEQGLINADNEISSELALRLEELELHFEAQKGTYMGSRCIEKEIRSLAVSAQVSPVSAVPFVRKYVDERLHELAQKGRVVMDGRDIGTTVLPRAELKIFMTARPEVRAQRRFDEIVAKGGSASLEEIKANLAERDYIDSHREHSPLRRAEDAFELDNSDMTMSEELAWAKGLIQGKFGIL